MQRIREILSGWLREGQADRVLGWKKGELPGMREPAFFHTEKELEELVYDRFCGPNLSKFLIAAGEKPGVTAVLVKPCDSYSLNELIRENRVRREQVRILGVPCKGNVDPRALEGKGVLAVREEEEQLMLSTLYGEEILPLSQVLLERCRVCRGKKHAVYDELLDPGQEEGPAGADRFAEVARLENMTEEERYAFWQGEFSRCIRCNACRNACPACNCRVCVFDGPAFDSSQKANAVPFEESMFHIVRAFHVAGRCTDCGECSRVCPQRIPLHLLNRKLILDANELYGDYQAGADPDSRPPMMAFSPDDPEPDVIYGRTQP